MASGRGECLGTFSSDVITLMMIGNCIRSLDVPTRWNTVYIMLQTAVIFQGVFERYEVSDADFRADFLPGGSYANIGLPTKVDWTIVERFVKVLQYFYELTVRVSGSLFVTSNTFLDEISDVDDLLNEWLRSEDEDLVNMARHMKTKFDKYWGNINKMNMMLYVAVMLDPRHKFSYLIYIFKNMYGSERGEMMSELAKNALYDAFEDYKKLYGNTTPMSTVSSSNMEIESIVLGASSDTDSERRFFRANRRKYQQMLSEIGGIDESELDVYLHEQIEKDNPKFDVLEWWKVHSPRFPILSRLARDVLAVPISTVASEYAFSTGGRIIDDFRASLTPKMAQALICCQDWLRHNPLKNSEEDYDFVQNIERYFSQSIGIESNVIGI